MSEPIKVINVIIVMMSNGTRVNKQRVIAERRSENQYSPWRDSRMTTTTTTSLFTYGKPQAIEQRELRFGALGLVGRAPLVGRESDERERREVSEWGKWDTTTRQNRKRRTAAAVNES
jgi:hypothetical protein